ncbi:lysophospholipid acyltransferase family protein [Microbacterium sp. RD1]|uniref:lysophospholipid acyltransferase family protein n=1 Tax=Microbacterium sp. RD1 TaxID=3457313 RepID=UPI003FA60375
MSGVPASPEKRRPSVYWLLGGLVVPAISLLAKIEIEGKENVPRSGAFVLTPNHVSELDPLIVAVAVWRIGRAPTFFAKESLFRVPVLGAAMRAAKMIPVSRSASSSAARETIRQAEIVAANGRGIIVYPEGSLTRDPEMWPMRGKTGAVRLALAGDLPVIPVAHWGVQEIFPRYGKLRVFPLRRRVRMVIGEPVDLAEFRGAQTEPAVLSRATSVVMDRIADLVSRLRGIPAPAQRWNPSAHGQNETGRLEP